MSLQAVESSAGLVMSIAVGGLIGSLANVLVAKLWKKELSDLSKYSSTEKKLMHIAHAFLPPFLVAIAAPSILSMLPWDGSSAMFGLIFAFIASASAFNHVITSMTMKAINKDS